MSTIRLKNAKISQKIVEKKSLKRQKKTKSCTGQNFVRKTNNSKKLMKTCHQNV